jgi:hypothetical protein
MYRFVRPANNKPTLFVNIYNFGGKEMPLESNGVAKSLAEAVKDARDYEEQYLYSLTDVGQVDLSAHFSEGYQDRRDFDATIDARIDAAKEGRP